MSIVNVAPPVVTGGGYNPSAIITKKTAAVAVSLGAAIVGELVGRDISNVSSENIEELMATIINKELPVK